MKSEHKVSLLLGVLILGLDALTKWLASAWLMFRAPVELFPGLRLGYAQNTGIAFSVLSGGGWRFWLVCVLGFSILMYLAIRLYRSKHVWESVGLTLVCAGALGNLLNRLLFGYVIDFVDCYVGRYHWPMFNVADSSIVIGMGILVWVWSRDPRV